MARGPHNIWRLLRTAGTFQKTGAMDVVLDQLDAPAGARAMLRVLGWPFQWLGYAGDPDLPPVTRAITALASSAGRMSRSVFPRCSSAGNPLICASRSLMLTYSSCGVMNASPIGAEW